MAQTTGGEISLVESGQHPVVEVIDPGVEDLVYDVLSCVALI